MSQDSTKVFIPGHGRYFRAPVDTPPPGQLLKVTGAPTSVTFTFTVNALTSTATILSANTQAANAALIAAGIASNLNVGAGKVFVFNGPDAYSFLIILDPSVPTPTITTTATFVGGSTPAVSMPAVGRGPFSAWTESGHTSQDNPLQINRAGGDVTTLGSWQADALDTSTAPVVLTLAYNLLQYDVVNMQRYYGANASLGADGTVQASQQGGTATSEALFLIMQNGGKAQARYWPSGSTTAADGETFDTTKFADMPLQTTVLASNTLPYGFSVSPTGVAA